MKPRQPFDDISNTNSRSCDSTATCLESQTVQGLGACESRSSETQSSSCDDGISTRLNESYNCEKVSKRTDLVPTTIYEAVICRGGNQATMGNETDIMRGGNQAMIDEEIDDVNPFKVLSDDKDMELEHGTNFISSTGICVEQPKKLEVRVRLRFLCQSCTPYNLLKQFFNEIIAFSQYIDRQVKTLKHNI